MKTAEVLVEHGADINVLNRYNESPLYLAAENTKDSTDLVVYLVEKYEIPHPYECCSNISQSEEPI